MCCKGAMHMEYQTLKVDLQLTANEDPLFNVCLFILQYLSAKFLLPDSYC